jgi:hypothetical protein
MPRVQLSGLAWGDVADSSGNARVGLIATIETVDGDSVTVYADAAGMGTVTAATQTDGTLPGWIEPGTYDVTVGGATTRVEAVSGQLPLNVLTYGVDPTGTTLSTTRLQAFIDAVQQGVKGYMPPGTYLSGPLSYDPDLPLDVEGAGEDITIIKAAADAGSGAYLLGASSLTTGQQPKTIRGVTFQGPVAPGWFSIGDSPAGMDGVNCQSRLKLYDCAIHGFRAGAVIDFDHQAFEGCNFGSNYYNVYFGPSSSFADQSFTNCDLTGATFAGVAVARQNGLEWTGWRDCHFGFSPYCIYFEPGAGAGFGGGPAPQGSIYFSTFENCAFENYGNGLIGDEDGDKYIVGMTMEARGSGFNAAYKIAARGKPASIVCGTLLDSEIRGGIAFGTEAAIKSNNSGGAFGVKDLRWRQARDTLEAALASAVPILKAARLDYATIEGDGVECWFAKANEALARFDVLAAWSGQQVYKYDASAGRTILAGVAWCDTANGVIGPVVVRGRATVKTDETTLSNPAILAPRMTVAGKARTAYAGEATLGHSIGAYATFGGVGIVEAMIDVAVCETAPPHAHVGLAVDQSIPNNTYTTLLCATEYQDNAAMHSTSSNTDQVAVPVAGLYAIEAGVAWDAATTAGTRTLHIEATGFVRKSATAPAASMSGIASYFWQSCSALVRLAAGDVVKMAVQQNSGGALNAKSVGHPSSLSVTYLGA